MRMKWLMCAAYAVVAATAYARSAAIDFRTDKTGAGWDLGDTQYDTSRGRKFPNDDAVLTSPCFDGNITSMTVVVSFTQSVSNAPAINVWAGSDTNSATLRDSITNRTTNVSTTNVLTFASADAIHALKFTSDRKGNTRVNPFIVSVTVRWVGGALSAPVNLVAASTSANAFHALWDTVEDAEEYTFRVWQNVLRPPSCDYVWNETFEGMTNVTENNNTEWSARMDELPFDVSGWTGAVVRHATGCGGAIQVGTGSNPGTLLSPPLPAADGLKLVVEGLFPNRATGTMPVKLVQGGVTNDLEDVAFNKTLQEKVIDLPALSAESRLLFCSPTNGTERRVRLESVAVVSNYVAASGAEVDVPGWEAHVTTEPCVDVTGLSTGTYYCAVQAFDGAVRSAWSESASVTLVEEVAPPPEVDPVTLMIPLANTDCIYTTDWNWLGTDGGVCTNGMVGLGLLAAKSKTAWNGNLSAVTNGYKFSQGGFYSQAMADASDRAFVMRATGDDDHVLTVTVVNNGKTAIESFDISYLGVQTFDGATNDPPRRLEAAWCTATAATYPDPFAVEGWTAVPDLDFVELSSVKAGPVFLTTEVHGVITLEPKLEPGKVFSFRLRFAKGTNAPALGIDNLRLAATFAPPEKRPTYVIFR